jgi:hypothetical protein
MLGGGLQRQRPVPGGDRETRLLGHLDSAHRVAAKEFRVAMNEGRAEGESQQQDERDCGQSQVGQTWMSEQMSDALWRWSDGGKSPVVVDAASCTLGLKDDILEHLDDERIRIG